MLSGMPMLGGIKMAPLPASVMPSTISVKERIEDDEHGGSYGNAYSIAHVRFERSAAITAETAAGAQGGYVIATGMKGRIFIDAENSEGARQIAEGARVSVDGGEAMEAVTVSRYDNADGTPHHWEVDVR